MQHDDDIVPFPEAPAAAPPREPTSPVTRRKPSRLSKLVWPLSLAVAVVLVYGAISPDDKKSVAHAEEPAPEPMRPAPRAVHTPPVAPEPVFTPTTTAAAPKAALPPLPPNTALPPVDPEADVRAAEAAEAARLRRRAPLMVEVGGGQVTKLAHAPAADLEAGVVQDVMTTPARREATQASALSTSGPPPAAHTTPMNTLGESRLGGPVVFEDASALERQILQGKTIPAVLETPIHTDLPGSLRAMVDEDVYAEAGRNVMIPRMSRLIGEYRKDVRPGQSRVLVVWQRVLLPDGTSLRLMSPGTDGLGRAGMAGDVDNHFFARFGAAFLVSMIGVAAENASQQNRALTNGSVVIWGSESKSVALEGLNATVESVLKSQADIPPTIQVPQGSRVRVFVARDLDLSKAPEGR